MTGNSEVARLRQQIAAEYEAARRGLHGYAITSKHEFINARLTNVGVYHEQLATLIGPEEAIKAVADIAGQQTT